MTSNVWNGLIKGKRSRFITVMSDRQWGIANSNHPFLLEVRPDLVAAGNPAMLRREYCEEIRDRGFLVSWSPQEGVFL
ncbi:hypothetical protein CUMW_208370, partial [Citrus unshiu]